MRDGLRWQSRRFPRDLDDWTGLIFAGRSKLTRVTHCRSSSGSPDRHRSIDSRRVMSQCRSEPSYSKVSSCALILIVQLS